MSQWLDSINLWLGANPQWLGVAVFVVACLECLTIIGIVIPGAVLLLALAVLAGSGALSLWETLLLATLGGLLGDIMSYGIGRYYHQDIHRLPVLRSHPKWLASAEEFFQRNGVISLLVGRFIGPLRPMLPTVAGMLNMPFGRFFAVSVLASVGWAVAYMLPGWATGAAFRLPLPPGFWQQAGFVVFGIGLVLGLSIWASTKRLRWASLFAALSSLALLVALMASWPRLSDLDHGLMTLVQEQRSEHLDMLMVLITRVGDWRTQLAAAVLLGVILLVGRQRRALALAIGSTLGSAIGNGLLKAIFERPRPQILLDPLGSYSFPSGHSSASFAFFLVLGVLAGREQAPRQRLTWLLVASLPALAIAMSRVYLGVHWPTDVIAGAMLASCMCAISLALVQWQKPLPAMPSKIWWLLLPSVIVMLLSITVFKLSSGLVMYQH
ncbi:bifunctional DedA family/phosphatase PAP2 family protein [Pseudomonas sp. 5P_3.1_Bac2]|uniref:bifunctional DedA family/phosphatase PAP2 family protein n=1 Tax=Pseudomonas sp. 5P_3.1_Bac2 TaxID=2971617 RepID=UPI0021C9632A|nr:bifunctional DedA family/phosphatase PAP2 family protein [Pseudomonas sp. 5P_3.1_Bac2]MCU1715587.1 bifunctional DedA family/phosphatase PAP2 family protein [Pseudomonas sp. 5P_3.1_Bac2]